MRVCVVGLARGDSLQPRSYVDVLGPVARLVRDIEGEAYETIAALPVLVARLFRDLDVLPTDAPSVVSLKRRLCVALDARVRFVLTDVNLALAAAAMHPAFGHLGFLSDRVVAELHRQMAQWVVDFPSLPLSPAAAHGPTRQVPPREPPVDARSVAAELAHTREHFKKHMPRPNDALHLPSVDDLRR